MHLKAFCVEFLKCDFFQQFDDINEKFRNFNLKKIICISFAKNYRNQIYISMCISYIIWKLYNE